jgi:hypothetical protein
MIAPASTRDAMLDNSFIEKVYNGTGTIVVAGPDTSDKTRVAVDKTVEHNFPPDKI